MAPKRGFVADSDDDEDFEDDEAIVNIASPPRRAALAVMDVYEPLPQQQGQQKQERLATPETEPLSPVHQPAYEARPRSSDSTSKSAFASIYQAHAQVQNQNQEKQSQLIENIVRQSQRVVGSGTGGSGSGHGSGEDGGDVTISHPVSFGCINAGDSMMMVSDRDEGPVLDEWDIPSSPEAGASATTLARNRRRSRGDSSGVGGGDAAGSFTPWDHEPTLPPLPAAKRSRVSLHDTAADSAGNVAGSGFYVAPSNLTTMQKLEYHRVSMPQMSTSEVLPALPLGGVMGGTPRMSTTQKSSGATTIAYTTPSRYASSGRPYPWEESMIVDEVGRDGNVDEDGNVDDEVAVNDHADEEISMQLEADQEAVAEPGSTLPEPEIINIPSSPDIIADERPSSRRRKRAGMPEAVDKPAQDSPVRASTRPSAKKRKSRQVSYKEEADELAGHDDMWAVQDDDIPAESYKPRSSLRRAKAVTPRKEDVVNDLDLSHANIDEDELAPTQEHRTRPAKKSKRQIQDSDDDEDDFAAQEVEPDVEQGPAPTSKRRGRKKKENSALDSPVEFLTAENEEELQQEENYHAEPPAEALAEDVPEPPKKRGRKKKQTTPASVPVEDFAVEDEQGKRQVDNTYAEPIVAEVLEEGPQPPKKKRGRPKKADKAKESIAAKDQEEQLAALAKEEVGQDEPAVTSEQADKAKPRSPSPKRSPLETKDPNAGVTPKEGQKQESKDIKEKEVKPIVKPVSALSTPVNARYRVGLSKKSRIAPLLKIIRK